MPDWDKLHERKKQEINLGIAKKGALMLLKHNRNPNWKNIYKGIVFVLYQLNVEIDKEILEGKIDGKILTKELEVLQ